MIIRKLSIIILLLIWTTAYCETTPIPEQSDWSDGGVALNNGGSGAWDYWLQGAVSPCGVLKIDGTYFLYYIGASGGRDESPSDPAYRKLGVATSSDGLDYTAYGSNPIITYNPRGVNYDEEGIFSCAVYNDGGTILLYYGAMYEYTAGSVHTSIRKRESSDGYTFTGDTEVLAYNSGCSGCGDEIFPTGVFKSGSTYYLYYMTDGWDLRMATMTDADTVSTTEAIITTGDSVRGMDGVIVRPDGEVIIAVGRYDGSDVNIQLRADTESDPNDFDTLLETWDFFPAYQEYAVYLDTDVGKWFIYLTNYNNDTIRVFSADGPTDGTATTGMSGGGIGRN